MKKLYGAFFALITSFILIVTFQNCSKTNFGDSSKESLFSSLSTSFISINNDAAYTNKTAVAVQINMDAPAEMYVTNNPSCADGGHWQSFSREIPWTLGEVNKTTAVYAKFRSTYGAETDCISDTIIHDDIAPTLALMQAIPAVSNEATTPVKTMASDTGSGIARMECPADVTSCTTDMTVTNSQEGTRLLNMYAVDKAGNKSAVLNVSWIYDKTGPNLMFSKTPGMKTNQTKADFELSANDNYSSADKITFKYSLDGAAYASTTAAFSLTVAEGKHTVKAYAYDLAGNSSIETSYTWDVGLKNPTLKFTDVPKPYVNTKYPVSFEGADQFGGPLAKYECSFNGSAPVTCTSPYSLATAAHIEGVNKFKVRGTDNLGLFSEIETTWVYDTTKPVLSFKTKPAAFSKKHDEAVQVNLAEANIKNIIFYLDNNNVHDSLDTAYTLQNLTEIQHEIKVQAVDMAGNTSDAITYKFWSDFTAPTLKLPVIATPSATKDKDIVFDAYDNTVDTANILTYAYNLDLAANDTLFAGSPLMLRNLTSTTHKLKVSVTDAAGNKTEAMSNDFMVDLDPPVITFDKKPADNINAGPYSKATINFRVTDPGSGIKTYDCGLTFNNAIINLPVDSAGQTCPNGGDIVLNITMPGTYVFSVKAEDNVGWVSTKTITWVAAKTYIDKSLSFNIAPGSTNNKVDILLVIDNSGSMAEEQTKMAAAFANFINNLNGLDWRIAITTTDIVNSYVGAKGSIIKFGAANDVNAPYFIDNNTTNNIVMLQQYIVSVGTSGSGDERGLSAIQMFIDRVKSPPSGQTNSIPPADIISNPNEKAFFRSDAVFATVVVSDSDEAQYSTQYGNADNFLNGPASSHDLGLYNKLPGKTYINHSVVILATDSNACKNSGEHIGKTYSDVSTATNGISASICAADYGNQLQSFATSIITKVTEKTLECTPVDTDDPDTDIDIQVSYAGSASGPATIIPRTSYTLSNNILRFTTPLTAVGDYTVNYSCLNLP